LRGGVGREPILDQFYFGSRGLQCTRGLGLGDVGHEEDQEVDQHQSEQPAGSGLHEHHFCARHLLHALSTRPRPQVGVHCRVHCTNHCATHNGSLGFQKDL